MNIRISKATEESRIEEQKATIEEFINFHLLEIEHNGKKHLYDIGPLISISNKTIESLSPEELDNALERTSAYRFSVAHLKELVNETLQENSENFDSWMANNWEFAVRVAIQRRKQIKSDEGSTAGWINSVTKEEIRGIIATHQTTIENYNSKIKQIWKYEKANRLLSNLLSILEDRGSQLQSIIKSRQTKKFSV